MKVAFRLVLLAGLAGLELLALDRFVSGRPEKIVVKKISDLAPLPTSPPQTTTSPAPPRPATYGQRVRQRRRNRFRHQPGAGARTVKRAR